MSNNNLPKIDSSKEDPCCCQWGCDCRIRNGVCHICEAKRKIRINNTK